MTLPSVSTPACELTAHRGDTSEHRENTIPALRAAIDAGVSTVEIDLQVTADGEVVLLHDQTLDRLWGVRAAVGAVGWPDLRELGGPSLRIPRLAEALDLFDNARPVLLIDLDTPGPAAAAHAVVAAHRAATTAHSPARVAWCGRLDAMRVIRELDPDAEIWMPWHSGTAPTAEDLSELRPAVLNVPHLVVNPQLVGAAHDLGVRVSCWTVDNQTQARHLRSVGVDSITTNQPHELSRELDRPTAVDDPGSERRRARDIAIALAREAIEHVRTMPLGRIDTKKNPADHATDIDRAIERRVREVIGAQFPLHAFVGEEYGGAAGDGIPCWYLDPVDGTANLANGIPWTSFSLALVEEGVPVVAVVADPWRELIVDAAAGEGAWVAGRRLDLHSDAEPSATPLSGSIVSTELAGHRPWDGLPGFIDSLAEQFCTTRIMGSGTLAVAGVALGHGAGAVISAFGPEDHLAAMLIVKEAGGVVLDETGRDTLFPSVGGIFAARDRHSADAIMDVWRSARHGHS
jgi:myo-inositol-1(or 4)-monophosphatase